ncbi:hypothetical protein AFFFEF_02147 [Methylorubrum extorquens]
MRRGPRPKLVGDPDYLDFLPAGASAEPGVPRQEDCAICGLVGAGCFGFGVLRGCRGIWACEDPECRAEARARSGIPNHQLEAAE